MDLPDPQSVVNWKFAYDHMDHSARYEYVLNFPVTRIVTSRSDMRGMDNRANDFKCVPLVQQQFVLIKANIDEFELIWVSPVLLSSLLTFCVSIDSLKATGRTKLRTLASMYNLDPKTMFEVINGTYIYAYFQLQIDSLVAPVPYLN
jgi:hypothetical protein